MKESTWSNCDPVTPRQAAANLAGMLAALPADLAFAGRHGKRWELWASRCSVAGSLLADLWRQARQAEEAWRREARVEGRYDGFDPGLLRAALAGTAAMTGWLLVRAGSGWPAGPEAAERLGRWVALTVPAKGAEEPVGARGAKPAVPTAASGH